MSPPPFRSAALRTMLAIPRQRNRGTAAKRPRLVSMTPPPATTRRWHGAASMAARCAAVSASASSLSQDPATGGFHRNDPAGASARLHRDRPRGSTLVAVTDQEDIPSQLDIPSAPTPVSDRSAQYLLLIPSSRVNRRHHTVLDAIFRDPVPANVEWTDVEPLVTGAGGTVEEGRGPRVRFELNGVRANFHRPHPRKEARRYQVRHLRDFFAAAGVIP